MHQLLIEWQHYDKAGDICDRCSQTGKSLIEAIGAIKSDSHFSGIKIDFKETKLADSQLDDSNKILLNDVPLEKLLNNTEVIYTPCKSCCELIGSDVNCRALNCQGQVFEDISQNLVFKAARKLLEREVKE
jgi:hypothetical protein